jgi:hypothetical protein
MVAPCDELAGSIYPGFEKVKPRGAIEVMPHVIFTRPEHFDGSAGDFRNPSGLDHAVIDQTPAEAAADTGKMNSNLVG